MIKKIKRLAIIPARSGSKRILNKNIKNFIDRPIINFSIDNAIKSKLFKKIHISTDSIKFKKYIEKKNKIKIDFLRPKKISNDNTPLIDVVGFVKKAFKERNFFFDEIWLIYACSPLTRFQDLILASKKYQLTDKKFPLISIRRFDAPIEWSLKKKRNIYIPNFKDKLKLDSKKIMPCYYESASFIIFDDKILKKKNRFEKFYGYELPRERSIDIDNISDWNIAEHLYKFNKKGL